MNRSIAREWTIYQDEVLNLKTDGTTVRLAAPGPGGHERPLTPEERRQVKELRRAFYGGASALYAMVVGLASARITDDQAGALLATVGEEILGMAKTEGRRRK